MGKDPGFLPHVRALSRTLQNLPYTPQGSRAEALPQLEPLLHCTSQTLAGGKGSGFSGGPEDPTLGSGFIQTGCPKREEVRACLNMPLHSPDVCGS